VGSVDKGGVRGIAAHTDNRLEMMVGSVVGGEQGGRVGNIIIDAAPEAHQGGEDVVVSSSRKYRPEKRREAEARARASDWAPGTGRKRAAKRDRRNCLPSIIAGRYDLVSKGLQNPIDKLHSHIPDQCQRSNNTTCPHCVWRPPDQQAQPEPQPPQSPPEAGGGIKVNVPALQPADNSHLLDEAKHASRSLFFAALYCTISAAFSYPDVLTISKSCLGFHDLWHSHGSSRSRSTIEMSYLCFSGHFNNVFMIAAASALAASPFARSGEMTPLIFQSGWSSWSGQYRAGVMASSGMDRKKSDFLSDRL